MDPYTPNRARKKKLTLSAKEYTKVCFILFYFYFPNTGLTYGGQITGTIASVRRNRQLQQNSIGEETSSRGHDSARSVFELSMLRVLADPCPLEDHSEPSFIAETSFVRAPLNSRVGPAPALPKSKGKSRQESLDGVPVDIQEAIILEDLLYVLMVRFFTTPKT